MIFRGGFFMKFLLDSLHMKKYIISYVTAFLITLLILGLLGILFSLLNPPEFATNFVRRYMYCLSSFMAAIFSTYGAKNSGLLKGIVSADIYMAILLVCGMIFFGSAYNVHSLIKILGISSLCGAFGGVIGINFKK